MSQEHDRAAELAARDYQAVFDAAPSGMAVVVGGEVVAVNRELCRILGAAQDELVGRPVGAIGEWLACGEEAEELRRVVGRTGRESRLELECTRADGIATWVEVQVGVLAPRPDAVERWIVQVHDITERVELHRREHELARHDALTGLLNRRGFNEELDEHAADARRYVGGALLVIDVDDFKGINDRHHLGHAGGDEVLVSIASTLADRLRATDVVCRIGGDEFAVLLPRTPLTAAMSLAVELAEEVREHCGVTLSIGVAPIDESRAQAMPAADAAMYRAKRRGGDQVQGPETQ